MIAPQNNLDILKQRLGMVDTQQIQLLLQVSPAQRILTLTSSQDMLLSSWRTRLRRAHPHLSDLELCHLLFKRLHHDHTF